jgi:hypothetical protein
MDDGFPSPEPIQMRLPRDARIRIEKPDALSSAIIIENSFATITLEIFIPPRDGGLNVLAFPEASNFLFPELFGDSPFARTVVMERAAQYKRYDAIISMEAKFDKLRYGFPEMKLYREWAANLFASLERRFAWGQPTLRELEEVLRSLR